MYNKSSYSYASGNTHCVCYNCNKHRAIDGRCSCGAPTMRVETLETGTDNLNTPSEESVSRAAYILNHYAKDSQADIICLARALDNHIKQYKDILDKILQEFPVGNIAEHTIESIPERISYYLKELAEYTQKVEAWEECAENLVDYAREFLANLSTWGKGYNRYDIELKQAEDAIKAFQKLKNE